MIQQIGWQVSRHKPIYSITSKVFTTSCSHFKNSHASRWFTVYRPTKKVKKQPVVNRRPAAKNNTFPRNVASHDAFSQDLGQPIEKALFNANSEANVRSIRNIWLHGLKGTGQMGDAKLTADPSSCPQAFVNDHDHLMISPTIVSVPRSFLIRPKPKFSKLSPGQAKDVVLGGQLLMVPQEGGNRADITQFIRRVWMDGLKEPNQKGNPGIMQDISLCPATYMNEGDTYVVTPTAVSFPRPEGVEFERKAIHLSDLAATMAAGELAIVPAISGIVETGVAAIAKSVAVGLRTLFSMFS